MARPYVFPRRLLIRERVLARFQQAAPNSGAAIVPLRKPTIVAKTASINRKS